MDKMNMKLVVIGIIAVTAFIMAMYALRNKKKEKYNDSSNLGPGGTPPGMPGNLSGPHRDVITCARMCRPGDMNCLQACKNVVIGLGNSGSPVQ